jgi:hypothetical protein
VAGQIHYTLGKKVLKLKINYVKRIGMDTINTIDFIIQSYFCRGLLIVTAEKGKGTEISYSDAHSLVTCFSGFML